MVTDSTRRTINPAALRGFRKHGVLLGGLSAATHLAPASRIEGPTAIGATVLSGGFLHIGAFCNLSGGTLNNIRVGRYCSMAQGVVTGSHEHPTDWLTTSRTAYFPEVHGWDVLMAGENAASVQARKARFPQSCPITTLGPDVWIGQGAFIKSGVTIGAGAIIGARATVVKDVPPYAIVVGTPGRVLRLRFPEPVVERLLKVQWWQYSIYDLFDAPMDNIEQALDVIEEQVAAGKLTPFAGPVLTAEDLMDPTAALQRMEERPLEPAI